MQPIKKYENISSQKIMALQNYDFKIMTLYDCKVIPTWLRIKKSSHQEPFLEKKVFCTSGLNLSKYTCLEYTYLVHATLLEINSFTTSFKGFRSQVQYSYSTEQLFLEQLILENTSRCF